MRVYDIIDKYYIKLCIYEHGINNTNKKYICDYVHTWPDLI